MMATESGSLFRLHHLPFGVQVMAVLYCLIFALCARSASASHPAVTLLDESSEYELGTHVDYLVDESARLSIDSVRFLKQSDFKSLDNRYFSSGVSESAFWFRVDLNNQSRTRQWWLALEPIARSTDLYIVQNNTVISHQQVSWETPLSSQTVSLAENLHTVELEPGARATLFIRMTAYGAVRTGFALRDSPTHMVANNHHTLFLGVFMGTMVSLGLYNLFLWFSVRDRAYLYYVAYIVSIAFYWTGLFNLNKQLFWPELAMPNGPIKHATAAIMLFFAANFVIHFLELKQSKHLTAYRLVSMFRVLALSTFLLAPVLSAFVHTTLTIVLVNLFTILAIVCGIRRIQDGYSPAKLFIVGWGSLMFSIVFMVFEVMGLFPPQSYTLYLSPVASMSEAIFLSMALASRIRALQADRNRLLAERARILQEGKEHLEHLNRTKDFFLSTMSHELRTPIHGILGNVDLLKQYHYATEQQRLLDEVEFATERMGETVGSILDFTDSQTGTLKPTSSAVNVRQLMQLLLHRFDREARQKNNRLHISVRDQVPQQLYLDGVFLEKILSKLINNAVKFTQKGSITIIVEGEFDDALEHKFNLKVSIKDTGCGIAPSRHNTLFVPFIQGDAGLNRGYSGVGLGLPLCQQLASLMSGHIRLVETSPSGSIFELQLGAPVLHKADTHGLPETIPTSIYSYYSDEDSGTVYASLAEDDEDTPAESPAPFEGAAEFESDQDEHHPNAYGNGRRILVVDDDNSNRLILKRMLRKMGYDSEEASDGHQALNKVEHNHYDLIFMDCQMPVMDGLETTRHIRQGAGPSQDSPIIALTANATSGFRQTCLDAGMTEYVSKPVRINAIAAIVKHWVKSTD